MFVDFLKHLLIILSSAIILTNDTMSATSNKLSSVNFEVFGRVQGVFFRKYTAKHANSLGIKGWCMNTENGTVQGVIEGENGKLEQMKKWLETTGSPQSRIDKAVFQEQKEIKQYSFKSFDIKR